ncbi:hypothetical protein MINTM005_13950 [Mycobacterium intracellulare]|uniref:hypothetical protein n=1 Tax=Mycobacterium intracellulare TaxID=1767 RepID=UPI001925CF31|nr:hypothetical protein [Mycobacterium intracellulare]BCO56151.1 hypothetical protein MINTM005_13950 [Mycobacterium intracellulare]
MNKEALFLAAAKLAAKHDCREDIIWSEDLTVSVDVSDLFHWACADAEEIESELDLWELGRAVADVLAVSPRARASNGFVLWVCRKRNCRPQGAFYKYLTVNEYTDDGRVVSVWDETRYNHATKQNGVLVSKVDEAKTAELRALFNQMPERPIDLGNPYDTENRYLYRADMEPTFASELK